MRSALVEARHECTRAVGDSDHSFRLADESRAFDCEAVILGGKNVMVALGVNEARIKLN